MTTTKKSLTPSVAIPRPLKPHVLGLYNQWLGMVARVRSMTTETRLPDFLIIGAQKCGTTYLYDKLVEHPQIAPALTKEVHFFDNGYSKGAKWYQGYFPAPQNGDITGEASPYYIFHPHAAQRIKKTLPHAKLILLLRNPVNRAYSHYHHEIRMGHESVSFETALAREEERLTGELDKMRHNEHYYSYNHQHYAYRLKGIYADQLQPWFDLFPREQLMVIQSETFYQNSPTVMGQVTNFLGLLSWDGWQFGKPKSAGYAKLDPVLRHSLSTYYTRHNRRLYDLLGVDFGWDTRG